MPDGDIPIQDSQAISTKDGTPSQQTLHTAELSKAAINPSYITAFDLISSDTLLGSLAFPPALTPGQVAVQKIVDGLMGMCMLLSCSFHAFYAVCRKLL